jgi:hypothetical protein
MGTDKVMLVQVKMATKHSYKQSNLKFFGLEIELLTKIGCMQPHAVNAR